jgi:hypothetical protein
VAAVTTAAGIGEGTAVDGLVLPVINTVTYWVDSTEGARNWRVRRSPLSEAAQPKGESLKRSAFRDRSLNSLPDL